MEFFGPKRLSFKNKDNGALAGENPSDLVQRAPKMHFKSYKTVSWVNSQVSAPGELASSCVTLPNSPGTNPWYSDYPKQCLLSKLGNKT